MADPMKTVVDPRKGVQKKLAIGVILKNRLSLVTLEVTW
jgi:hypothetical protein